jgi:hypothetical protein
MRIARISARSSALSCPSVTVAERLAASEARSSSIGRIADEHSGDRDAGEEQDALDGAEGLDPRVADQQHPEPEEQMDRKADALRDHEVPLEQLQRAQAVREAPCDQRQRQRDAAVEDEGPDVLATTRGRPSGTTAPDQVRGSPGRAQGHGERVRRAAFAGAFSRFLSCPHDSLLLNVKVAQRLSKPPSPARGRGAGERGTDMAAFMLRGGRRHVRWTGFAGRPI